MGGTISAPPEKVKILGTRINYLNDTSGTIRQAADDMLVSAITIDNNAEISGYFGSATPPTTKCQCNYGAGVSPSISFFVKKDEYWKITATSGNINIFTLPFEISIIC